MLAAEGTGAALDDPEESADRGALFEQLVTELLRSALRPLTERELVAHAGDILDDAWASWRPAEILKAITVCEGAGLRRLSDGRMVAAHEASDIRSAMVHLARATQCAEEIAEVEPAREPPGPEPWLQDWLFKAPLLTADDERRLGQRSQAGDRDAINRIVEANTRLAAELARRARRSATLGYDDLFQEACLGLIRAAEKFDPSLGNKFSTYATWWIRQSVARAQANTSRTIRLPVHVIDRLGRLERERQWVVKSYGLTDVPWDLSQDPWGPAVADKMGMTLGEIRSLCEAARITTVPLEGNAFDIPDRTEVSPEEQASERAWLQQFIDDLDHMFDARTLDILRRRMGIDGPAETLEQLGRAHRVTRERIRQIETEALKQFRDLRFRAARPPARGHGRAGSPRLPVDKPRLGAVHLTVLQWVARGCPTGSISPRSRATSAAAARLSSLGLIHVYAYRDAWRAQLTEAGAAAMRRLGGEAEDTATASASGNISYVTTADALPMRPPREAPSCTRR
jgi:RNA polymerase primary sigma factor